MTRDATDTQIDRDVTRMLVMERGSVLAEGDGQYRLCEWVCEGHGVWYAAVNSSADKVIKVEFRIDGEFKAMAEGSKTESGIKYTLKPGESQLLA